MHEEQTTSLERRFTPYGAAFYWRGELVGYADEAAPLHWPRGLGPQEVLAAGGLSLEERHRLMLWAQGFAVPPRYEALGRYFGCVARPQPRYFYLGRPLEHPEQVEDWDEALADLDNRARAHLAAWRRTGRWDLSRVEDWGVALLGFLYEGGRVLLDPQGHELYRSSDHAPRPELLRWLASAPTALLEKLGGSTFQTWKVNPHAPPDLTPLCTWERHGRPWMLVRLNGEVWLLGPQDEPRGGGPETDGLLRAAVAPGVWLIPRARRALARLAPLFSPHDPTAPLWVHATTGARIEGAKLGEVTSVRLLRLDGFEVLVTNTRQVYARHGDRWQMIGPHCEEGLLLALARERLIGLSPLAQRWGQQLPQGLLLAQYLGELDGVVYGIHPGGIVALSRRGCWKVWSGSSQEECVAELRRQGLRALEVQTRLAAL